MPRTNAESAEDERRRAEDERRRALRTRKPLVGSSARITNASAGKSRLCGANDSVINGEGLSPPNLIDATIADEFGNQNSVRWHSMTAAVRFKSSFMDQTLRP